MSISVFPIRVHYEERGIDILKEAVEVAGPYVKASMNRLCSQFDQSVETRTASR